MKNSILMKWNIAALVIGLCAATVTPMALAQNRQPKYKANLPESILTPDTVNTRLLGDLEYFDGMPSIATAEKSYDFIDVARGAQAFLSGIPAASVHAALEGFKDAGIKPGAKFYTEEGNWDLVGNNTPIFFIRDPLKFSDFIHSQKRHPVTRMRDGTMQWDFWSLSPESMHQVTWLIGERGIPRTLRHMDSFGSHTFSVWNEDGDRFWVKWHLKTQQGIACMPADEAGRIAGEDPDFHRRDLFEAIAHDDNPKWTLKVQIMPEAEAETYHLNPFDLTKVWPHREYPLMEVGVL